MQPAHGEPKATRAWYAASIDAFLIASADAVVGQLVRNAGAEILDTQVGAWRAQIDLLRGQLRVYPGPSCSSS